jgi:integrase
VFCHPDASPFTQSAIEAALRYACKRAGLRPIGSHILRHTFCSHLAMHGAAPKAIQELAGHSTLAMTMRYMRTLLRSRFVGDRTLKFWATSGQRRDHGFMK